MKDDDNEAVLEAHQRLEAVHRKSFVADLLGAPPPQFIAMEATNQQLFDVTWKKKYNKNWIRGRIRSFCENTKKPTTSDSLIDPFNF